MKTTTIQEVTSYLDTCFHPELQEDYDNAGFLFGDGSKPCTGALVAVDLTMAVVDEAKTVGANLIVTHHPFIFGGIKRITTATEVGRIVLRLAHEGIAVYAAHTNLDNLPQGVNGALARQLGLEQCRILKPIANHEECGAGMIGTLPHAEPVEQFLQRVKQTLGLPVVRHSALCVPEVQRIAICGGAGAFLIGDALRQQADIYLTADLKYHDFQRPEGRMVLADIGHYESEQYAKDVIYQTMIKKFSNFACQISTTQQGVVEYI